MHVVMLFKKYETNFVMTIWIQTVFKQLSGDKLFWSEQIYKHV